VNEPTPAELDALEAELQSLRPADASLELHHRVGRALSSHAGTPRGRLWLAAGALAAAACIVIGAAVALRGIGTPRPIETRIASTLPATESIDNIDDDRPALASYRRALSRSPDNLDDLLDRHAARALGGGTTAPAHARVTAASDLGILR